MVVFLEGGNVEQVTHQTMLYRWVFMYCISCMVIMEILCLLPKDSNLMMIIIIT